MSTLTTNKRWLLWLPLLCVAVWLGIFADKTPVDQIAATKQSIAAANKASSPTTTLNAVAKNDSSALEVLINRSKLIGSDDSKTLKWRNLFLSSSWTPPAAPTKPLSSVAIPTPTPNAPVFPFQYVGKKLEESIWEVYLSRGDKNFLVREGGTLEGTYRIDTITPQRLTVTYLPLGQSQSLSIGESQ